jgi:HlyD family secretion protein
MVAAGVWAWLPRPVAVQVVETARDVPIQVFGLGTVEAQILARVGFETAGTLVALRADHGDSVKASTVLARLDSREQEARVAQARAVVKQAEAAIEQAMANVERADALLKEKTLTNVRARSRSDSQQRSSAARHPSGAFPPRSCASTSRATVLMRSTVYMPAAAAVRWPFISVNRPRCGSPWRSCRARASLNLTPWPTFAASRLRRGRLRTADSGNAR